MGKKVDGDNLNGLWDAITGTEPFEICFDEMFEGCMTAPGLVSWSAIGLLLLEITFWCLVVRTTYKRIKRRKAHQQIHGAGIDRTHTVNNGNGQRSQRRLKRS